MDMRDPSEVAYHWYRPHQSCLMRYLYEEYCPVCMETLIESIHENSRSIIGYSPDSDDILIEDDDVTFSVDLLKPEPNTQKVDWVLDDVTVGHNVEQMLIRKGTLPEGIHTLTVYVEDTTQMVRIPDHAAIHLSGVVWSIQAKGATGIGSVSAASHDFTIGPLPFTTHLTFRSKEPTEEDIHMELWDVAGRCVASSNARNATQCDLTAAQLPVGVYLLRVYADGQRICQRKVTKR